MHTSPLSRALVWGCLAFALAVNVAGYVFDLYDRFAWFDEVIHAFTTFALTLPLILFLYGLTLRGAQSYPVLFVFTAASLGLAIGALWEIAEWAYDQLVPENAILGKLDTIIDLVMDILGALAAGIVSAGMINASNTGREKLQ